MAITTTSSTVSRRYYRGKSRRQIGRVIQDICQILGDPIPHPDALVALTIDQMIDRVMALHARLPDD